LAKYVIGKGPNGDILKDEADLTASEMYLLNQIHQADREYRKLVDDIGFSLKDLYNENERYRKDAKIAERGFIMAKRLLELIAEQFVDINKCNDDIDFAMRTLTISLWTLAYRSFYDMTLPEIDVERQCKFYPKKYLIEKYIDKKETVSHPDFDKAPF